MNYLPCVSWGFYAGSGATGANIAAGYTSWGLMQSLPSGTVAAGGLLSKSWRNFLYLFNKAKSRVRRS